MQGRKLRRSSPTKVKLINGGSGRSERQREINCASFSVFDCELQRGTLWKPDTLFDLGCKERKRSELNAEQKVGGAGQEMGARGGGVGGWGAGTGSLECLFHVAD